MRVRCFLREIRGARSLRDVARESGVDPSQLSKIELGMQFPKDEDIPALVGAYRAGLLDWYPPVVLLGVESDDAKLLDIQARLRTTLLTPEEAAHA